MRRAAWAVVLLLLVGAAAGCGSDDEDRNNAEYVALGDSYTSGPGMEPIADRKCARSEINYPSLVAKKLKIEDFADRSCGGAKTANLEEPQQYKDRQTGLPVRLNEPQLNALGKDTKLVTIGLGLNDQAIAPSLLLTCNSPGKPEVSAFCQQYLDRPQSSIDDQVRTVAKSVAAALATIKRKAPSAQVVLVGYPRLVPDEGPGCGTPGNADDLLPVPAAQVVRMRETMKVVNQVWRETAEQAGVLYVDMYTPSEGHDICSDDPWVSGYLGVPGKAIGLHPLPGYEEAVADAVVEVLGQD